MLAPVLKSVRPHQWVKNLFVAAPLVFARRVGDGAAVGHTVLAVAAFCLLSSAVYLINDLVDVDKDRAHPVKRNRPIASGTMPLGLARALAPLLGFGGISITVFLGPTCVVVGLGYLGLNLAYSFGLKKVAFIDVACISLSYLLRVLCGSAAIPVQPSKWLLVCTLLLSALLGFGKRAHELRVSGVDGTVQRDVLGKYALPTLQRLLVVLGVLTSVTYLAYTQSAFAHDFFGPFLWGSGSFLRFGVFSLPGLPAGNLNPPPFDSMLLASILNNFFSTGYFLLFFYFF